MAYIIVGAQEQELLVVVGYWIFGSNTRFGILQMASTILELMPIEIVPRLHEPPKG